MKLVMSVKSLRDIVLRTSTLRFNRRQELPVYFWLSNEGDIYAGVRSVYEQFVFRIKEAHVAGTWSNFAIAQSDLKCIVGNLREGSIELGIDKNVTVRYVEELWGMEVSVSVSSEQCCPISMYKGDWHPNDKMLSMHRKALKCVSRDETREILMGTYFDKDAVVGTDGRRMMAYIGSEANPKWVNPVEPFVVRDTVFLRSTNLKEPNGFAVECDNLWLNFGDMVYSSKLLSGGMMYPSWRQVVPSEDGYNNRIVFEDAALMPLEVFRGMMDIKEIGVSVVRKGKDVTLSAKNPFKGREMKASLKGKASLEGDGQICLNINFLIDAMKMGFRDFRLSGDKWNPIISEADGWKMVVMPLRDFKNVATSHT